MGYEIIDGQEKYEYLAPTLSVYGCFDVICYLDSQRFFIPDDSANDGYWIERRIHVRKRFKICRPELEENPEKLRNDFMNKALKECYQLYYDAVADLGPIMKHPGPEALNTKVYQSLSEKVREEP